MIYASVLPLIVDKKKMMSLLTFSLHYTKKNCRFYFAVHLFSNKSQMVSKCGKGIMNTLAQQLVCHFLNLQSNLDYPDLDYPDFSIIRTFSQVPFFS